MDEKAQKPPFWKLVAQVEAMARNWPLVYSSWSVLRNKIATGDNDSGLAHLIADWNSAAHQVLTKIHPDKLDELVNYALGAPGVVLGRALYRHSPAAIGEHFYETLSASWNGLRNYLDQRWFFSRLRRAKEDYPDTLLRAAVDGNLEAVLDEHLWITSQLQNLQGRELARELGEGLKLKSGLYHFHPLRSERDDTFSLRCHVAMPFVQSRVASPEGEEKPIRTDEMRRAFNTPFWPYVLATTSVGQEGLDFHAWCDRLVHWDLCRNPVDLEQREGRIQRFGGLAIRRAISQKLGPTAMKSREPGESPWQRLATLANEELSDESGLAPWWVCKDGNIERFVFETPTSEQNQWLPWMKEQRLLYRLALGQPNQEDLMQIISQWAGDDRDSIRRAIVNLSPWFRENAGPEPDSTGTPES